MKCQFFKTLYSFFSGAATVPPGAAASCGISCPNSCPAAAEQGPAPHPCSHLESVGPEPRQSFLYHLITARYCRYSIQLIGYRSSVKHPLYVFVCTAFWWTCLNSGFVSGTVPSWHLTSYDEINIIREVLFRFLSTVQHVALGCRYL